LVKDRSLHQHASLRRAVVLLLVCLIALTAGFKGEAVLAEGRIERAALSGTLPLCPDGQEYDAGLCYPKCDAGYNGIGPVCWAACPAGYKDDGALCRKDAVIQPKESYGRGAGSPLVCGPDKEQSGALCYPKCQSGYAGVGPVCWQVCPSGYRDDGAFCRKDAEIVAKNSYGRGAGSALTCGPNEEQDGALCYPRCQSGYYGVGPVCWQSCPSGYRDDGATCYKSIVDFFFKDTYGRGAGGPLNSCPTGYQKDGALCYTVCQAGYVGVGPVCWQTCPSGYTDDGAFCRKDAIIIAKASYGRSAGTPLDSCPAGSEKDGALCYPKCNAGYTGIGPVCWAACPAGFTDDGALCRKDAIIVPKGSYGRGAGTVPNCDINKLECSGNFEVYNSFRPKPWGYKFENWGVKADYPNNGDLDTATLIRMFGTGVCQTGSTAADCVLKASARSWRADRLASANGGHCYGMAVAAQRFYAGFDQAGNYQGGANNTFDLEAIAAVRANITEMFVTQSLSQASNNVGFLGEGKKPSEILEMIRANLRDTPNDPYVLAFYKTENGAFTSGHAVTPFAIQKRDDNVYWLHIYDNNWPEKDRYIIFNIANETWLYGFGATNPGETAGAWQGDTATDSLRLRPTSTHKSSGWSCPFCWRASLSAASASLTDAGERLSFSLAGAGSLLIRDAQSRNVGWHFDTKKSVNEIPGATVTYVPGGLGNGLGTVIGVPAPATPAPVTAFISSDALTQTRRVDLSFTGPGFVLSVDDILISPQQRLKMTFSPDGTQIAFTAGAFSAITPSIRLANDTSATGNGFLFDVGGITLAPSSTMTVSLDLNNKTLQFINDTPQTNAYDIAMLRITPQGADQPYTTDQAVLAGGAQGVMDFGGWDGSGPITFTLGGPPQPLGNGSVRKVFVPLVLR
jgi:hypothetical protein